MMFMILSTLVAYSDEPAPADTGVETDNVEDSRAALEAAQGAQTAQLNARIDALGKVDEIFNPPADPTVAVLEQRMREQALDDTEAAKDAWFASLTPQQQRKFNRQERRDERRALRRGEPWPSNNVALSRPTTSTNPHRGNLVELDEERAGRPMMREVIAGNYAGRVVDVAEDGDFTNNRSRVGRAARYGMYGYYDSGEGDTDWAALGYGSANTDGTVTLGGNTPVTTPVVQATQTYERPDGGGTRARQADVPTDEEQAEAILDSIE